MTNFFLLIRVKILTKRNTSLIVLKFDLHNTKDFTRLMLSDKRISSLNLILLLLVFWFLKQLMMIIIIINN